MNTTTMEGLVGARTNMDLHKTPFRFYKEAREKEKLEREKAIQKRKEEREKLEERIEESRNENRETDTVGVSEEGRVLLKENGVIDSKDSNNINLDNTVSQNTRTGK